MWFDLSFEMMLLPLVVKVRHLIFFERATRIMFDTGILRNNRIAETLCGHSGAVSCLSWNHIIRKGLASGSVDNTVAFWDLEKGDCLAMFHHHEQPVSSVAFHPVEPYLLATAGFDHKVPTLVYTDSIISISIL